MPLVALSDPHDVVAVIPTMANRRDSLEAAIQSVTSSTGPLRVAVVCVVNASTKPDVELESLGVDLRFAGINLGWAGGLAYGSGLSDADFVWFVQDDMIAAPGALAALVAALRNDKRLGAVAPLVLSADGLVVRHSCGGRTDGNGLVSDWLPAEPVAASELVGVGELSYIPSRGTLVRRDALAATGGPNPRLYPVQFVDVDFCRRLTAAGFGFELALTAHVTHEVQGSTPLGYAQFLHSRNGEGFRRFWFPDSQAAPREAFDVHRFRPDRTDRERLPIAADIDAELLGAVSQSAADTLTHLGRVFSAREAALLSELRGRNSLIDSMSESASWRITAPLRALRGRLPLAKKRRDTRA
jgi:GT2 family glycosyltransferase